MTLLEFPVFLGRGGETPGLVLAPMEFLFPVGEKVGFFGVGIFIFCVFCVFGGRN